MHLFILKKGSNVFLIDFITGLSKIVKYRSIYKTIFVVVDEFSKIRH